MTPVTRPMRLPALALAWAALLVVSGWLYAQSRYELTHRLSDSPTGGLAQAADGTFYGVTLSGGAERFGTVYRLTPSGPVTVASFTADMGFPSDGAGLLLASDGAFYGTTEGGSAAHPNGTVFRLTPSGTLSVWAAFNSANIGATPSGRLIQGTDGYLYGTALFGPGSAPGVVFRVDQAFGRSGAAGVIEAFAVFPSAGTESLGGAGESPATGVIEVDGSFYGTAMFGGAYNAGTIFRATAGNVSLVRSFNGSDGMTPASPLLLGSDRSLYGTTLGDATTSFGTLFRFRLDDSAFSNLVSFNGANGDFPYQQGVVESDGYLFGTTQSGGALRLGTVYRWSASTGLQVIHEMDDVTDGSPIATLTAASDGGLYGAGYRLDGGTIFRLVKEAPPVPVPAVGGFSPASGAVETQVRITGSNLQTATQVTFNGIPATSFWVQSGGTVFAAVPAGATTGRIAVTTAGGTATSASDFIVTASDSPASRVGVVAAYGFDEGAGSVLHDASMNANHGALVGNPTWDANGRFGAALRFDGVDDLVDVANSASLALSAQMTIEAWVRPELAQGDWQTIALKETAGGLAYSLYASDGAHVPNGYARVDGLERQVAGAAPLAANTWSHLATTYDGSNLRLYVNGALLQNVAVTGPIDASAGALRIGGNSVWGEYFKGLIDELRIHNVALTLSEIQADMLRPVGQDVPPAGNGLVAAYNFDEADGTAVVDRSGSGNVGVALGATRSGGYSGGALSFDGVDDYVAVPRSASLNLRAGMTLEARVRPTATLIAWRSVILKEAPNALSYALYANDVQPNPSGYVRIAGGEGAVQSGSGALPLNVWTHLVVTYDGEQLKLYADGALVGTAAQSGAILASDGQLTIGGNTVWDEYFTGLIDDVRIYNRPLSASEIQTNMMTSVQ